MTGIRYRVARWLVPYMRDVNDITRDEANFADDLYEQLVNQLADYAEDTTPPDAVIDGFVIGSTTRLCAELLHLSTAQPLCDAVNHLLAANPPEQAELRLRALRAVTCKCGTPTGTLDDETDESDARD